MNFAEYGLYSHLREVSSNTNFTYRFDDRTIAARFALERGVSRGTCNRLRNSLAKVGWIEWLEPKERRLGGQFASRLGRILSHKEYAAKYPDLCRTVLNDEHGTVLKSGGSPCSNQAARRAHQRDIKGIVQKGRKTNAKQGDPASPSPSSPLPSDSQIEAPALQCEPPCSSVSTVKLYAVHDTASDSTSQADALCTRFAPSNELSELPEAVQKLALLIEAYVGVPQRFTDLPNLERMGKLSPSQAEAIFKWVEKNPDPFWSSRLSGRTALQFFCKNILTIVKQWNNEARRSKAKLKAASVAHNPAKPFAYLGETI
jgi:hypothetical protein